ncbi:MAG TPA: type VI secretion system ATPase TssH [Orrella sp.]
MQIVEFKGLVDRLNPLCRDALENAAGACVARNQYEISVEHFLTKLIDDPRGDVQLVLKQLEMDPSRLLRALEQSIESMQTGNTGRPQFSALLPELFADAWLVASVELFESSIRSAALLAAFVERSSFYAQNTYAALLKDLNKTRVMDALAIVASNSLENVTATASMSSATSANGGGLASGQSAIARFCEDFTAKARENKVDPVFGRDAEIRQMVDILARRRKNNPICVGDPGVGKTAVVEGLAVRVVENDVPEVLQGVTILGLDMGALEAGAGVKGEFEKRLRGVIDEIKASPNPILLFIDEAHTLIGAGGAAGNNDAANLLKPALARGELRTIAATTWSEYKRYFEKDPALARRFELVKLDEPSVEMAVQILRGLKERYEQVHRVIIRDDALRAAAELSDRYITGRQLPDKAIDLLDTACARIKVNLSSKPDFIEDLERQLQMLAREKQGLTRDRDNRIEVDEQRLISIDEETKSLQDRLAQRQQDFDAQLTAAREVLKQRTQLSQARETEQNEDISAAERALDVAETHFSQLQAIEKLVFVDVSPDTIAKVVSDRTGVPLGKMMRDQASAALAMQSTLIQHIKGQDHAMHQIAEVLKSSRSGLRDPDQPLGIFLLVGPSGTGKTETALSVADIMFGGEQSLISVNMSEFQEKHTVSRLVGSPPGYVGYGEGGVLTEAVRQRPYSVVLLDEVEKAHLDVVNLFYQVFDKGVLSDGEGREINFRNTVVFLTSNLGLDVITELCSGDEMPSAETITAAIRPILSNHFKPALLARMTIVPYLTLPQAVLREIVDIKLKKVSDRMLSTNKITLDVSAQAADAIAARCTEVETGARNIDFILRGTILPLLSDRLLASMSQSDSVTTAKLGLDDDGHFTVEFA